MNEGEIVRNYIIDDTNKKQQKFSDFINPLQINSEDTIFDNKYPNAKMYLIEATKPIKKEKIKTIV